MSDEQDGGSSPLGELLGALPSATETLPYAPLHVRVLDVETEGQLSAMLTAWEVDPDPNLFFHQVRERLEGVLLAELSLPASQLEADYRSGWDSCLLATFESLSPELDSALGLLGLHPSPTDTPAWRRAITHLRAESQLVNVELQESNLVSYQAGVLRSHQTDEALMLEEKRLRAALAETTWGSRPGEFWRTYIGASDAAPHPAPSDLASLEKRLVSTSEGVIRWLPPMLFQVACDLIGLLFASHYGVGTQWAPCEPDELGLAPPPLLRLEAKSGAVHIPIGLHILRWWVMPLKAGETPASLVEWLEDQAQSIR